MNNKYNMDDSLQNYFETKDGGWGMKRIIALIILFLFAANVLVMASTEYFYEIEEGNLSSLPAALTVEERKIVIKFIRDFNRFKFDISLIDEIDVFVDECLHKNMILNMKRFNDLNSGIKKQFEEVGRFPSIVDPGKKGLSGPIVFALAKLSQYKSTYIWARAFMLSNLADYVRTGDSSYKLGIINWRNNVTDERFAHPNNNYFKQKELSEKIISLISKRYEIDWYTIK